MLAQQIILFQIEATWRKQNIFKCIVRLQIAGKPVILICFFFGSGGVGSYQVLNSLWQDIQIYSYSTIFCSHCCLVNSTVKTVKIRHWFCSVSQKRRTSSSNCGQTNRILHNEYLLVFRSVFLFKIVYLHGSP